MSENTAEAQAKAIADEYGQFKAVQDITHNGVLAYHKGDSVPASNVEAHGYLDDGLVEKVTKAKAAAKTKEG